MRYGSDRAEINSFSAAGSSFVETSHTHQAFYNNRRFSADVFFDCVRAKDQLNEIRRSHPSKTNMRQFFMIMMSAIFIVPTAGAGGQVTYVDQSVSCRPGQAISDIWWVQEAKGYNEYSIACQNVSDSCQEVKKFK